MNAAILFVCPLPALEDNFILLGIHIRQGMEANSRVDAKEAERKRGQVDLRSITRIFATLKLLRFPFDDFLSND
jgi:hypothetical protein